MVIKCALGRLKGKFGVLKCKVDINLKDLQHVIISCFIPHKYCEANGNHIFSEAIEKAIKYFNLVLQLLGIKVQFLQEVRRFEIFL